VGTTLTKYFSGAGGLPTTERVGANGPLSYLASDGQGTVSEALDGSGNVTFQQLFTPYGTSRYSSGISPTTLGYTGQRTDSTTGLDYYQARYYDPVAGQFISSDTVNDGFNDYGYVAGNPETATDPSGHRCFNLDGAVCGTPAPTYKPPVSTPPPPGGCRGGTVCSLSHSCETASDCLDTLVVSVNAEAACSPASGDICVRGQQGADSIFNLLDGDPFHSAARLIGVGYQGLKDILEWLVQLKAAGDRYFDDQRLKALAFAVAEGIFAPPFAKIFSLGIAGVGYYYIQEKEKFDANIGAIINQLILIRQRMETPEMLDAHPELNRVEFHLESQGSGDDRYLGMSIVLPTLSSLSAV
jgi:RHS repeat-associated protein